MYCIFPSSCTICICSWICVPVCVLQAPKASYHVGWFVRPPLVWHWSESQSPFQVDHRPRASMIEDDDAAYESVSQRLTYGHLECEAHPFIGYRLTTPRKYGTSSAFCNRRLVISSAVIFFRLTLPLQGNKYKVDWEGLDPATGKPWPPSWVLKTDCTEALVEEWEAQKREQKERKKSRKSNCMSVCNSCASTQT